MRKILLAAAAVVACGASSASAGLSVLVYDENSNNHYAATAANSLFAGQVTVAGAGNFNTLLTSQSWDLVVLDYPSTHPVGGIDPLIGYVNGGGRAILSTWSLVYTPQLYTAFGATSGFSISTFGQTLSAAGTPAGATTFFGVPMPHSSWSETWGSDGVAYTGLLAGTQGLAFLTGPAGTNPVMILGNGGRTIATFVIDEWQGPGAVQLWENMMVQLIPAPSAVALLGIAGFGGLRRRRA